MDSIKVGNTIAFLRKQAGMTQNELAQKLNVTDKAVSRWERGVGAPDISLLTRLSSILDTDIEAVLEGNFTNEEPDCKGLLVLNYSKGINAASFIYTKRVVFFQLSFFLLAGIRNICIRGLKTDIDFVRKELEDGKRLGIQLEYEVIERTRFNKNYLSSNYFCKHHQSFSFLVIDELVFLYGKDMTSTLKRIILDSETCTQLTDYKKNLFPIKFFPSQHRLDTLGRCFENSTSWKNYSLLRGIIAFPIKCENDLLAAGNIIQIIEQQQKEIVSDLKEIAINRGFLQDK